MHRHYNSQISTLQSLFGTAEVALESDLLQVRQRRFPIQDDVILLNDPDEYSELVARRLGGGQGGGRDGFAADIQRTFGREWQSYGSLLPEHGAEFQQYFDLIDLDAIQSARVLDLGCGMGRWSYHLAPYVKELVLIDFSDAIFVARENLRGRHPRTLFFQADITELPFADNCADLGICLGVLHHLPFDCLQATRQLSRLTPRLLVYLYYALDNRPVHYRGVLRAATMIRKILCRIKTERLRKLFAKIGARSVYRPLVHLGRILETVGRGSHVPLFDFYKDKSLDRIEQDVYDRFFTRIEQRVSRDDILELKDAFETITISDQLPYWHFLCEDQRLVRSGELHVDPSNADASRA